HVGAGQSGDVMLPSGISTVRYEVYDPQGNELSTGSAEGNALGGFDLSFDIPENSNLGYAGIRLNTNGGEYYHEFQLQDVRRPEFEVTARNESEGPFIVGDSATVSLRSEESRVGNVQMRW